MTGYQARMARQAAPSVSSGVRSFPWAMGILFLCYTHSQRLSHLMAFQHPAALRGTHTSLSALPTPARIAPARTACYLILHQHGNVHKHVVKLLDAALQPHDVLVPSLDLAEGLLGNLRVNDLEKPHKVML